MAERKIEVKKKMDDLFVQFKKLYVYIVYL